MTYDQRTSMQNVCYKIP